MPSPYPSGECQRGDAREHGSSGSSTPSTARRDVGREPERQRPEQAKTARLIQPWVKRHPTGLEVADTRTKGSPGRADPPYRHGHQPRPLDPKAAGQHPPHAPQEDREPVDHPIGSPITDGFCHQFTHRLIQIRSQSHVQQSFGPRPRSATEDTRFPPCYNVRGKRKSCRDYYDRSPVEWQLGIGDSMRR